MILGGNMKQLGKVIFRFFRGQSGLTLLEVLISVALVGAIGTGVLTALQTNYRSTQTLDEKVTAGNLATAYIEAIRNLPFAVTYPTAGDNITVPAQYTVTVDTACTSDGTSFDTCTGSDNQTFQRITISVSREGRPVFNMCSFRTER
jgi:prepilin-type N-terminal cleavage/methylation domain-containing protein